MSNLMDKIQNKLSGDSKDDSNRRNKQQSSDMNQEWKSGDDFNQQSDLGRQTRSQGQGKQSGGDYNDQSLGSDMAGDTFQDDSNTGSNQGMGRGSDRRKQQGNKFSSQTDPSDMVQDMEDTYNRRGNQDQGNKNF